MLDVSKYHRFGGGGIKNPSLDENLLAQGVTPAINILRSVSALHKLEPNRRLSDVLTRGIAGQTRYQGAIAQLGERYNGIVEVSGSIPLSSTNFSISRSKPLFQRSLESILLARIHRVRARSYCYGFASTIMALPVPLWPWLAFAGMKGKLDALRQQRRWRFRDIQEAHVAFWQREAGRR